MKTRKRQTLASVLAPVLGLFAILALAAGPALARPWTAGASVRVAQLSGQTADTVTVDENADDDPGDQGVDEDQGDQGEQTVDETDTDQVETDTDTETETETDSQSANQSSGDQTEKSDPGDSGDSGDSGGDSGD
jgi:hypothetical protein